MKIKNKSNKKKIIISLIILATILVGGSAWAAVAQVDPFAKDKIAEHKPEKSNKENEQNTQQNTPDDSSEPSSEKIIRPDTNDTPQGDLERPNITRTEQVGDFIRISALFNKSSSGKCLLKLSKVGQTTIQKEAFIIVGPSYYTCNGFRIPRDELPASGKWDIMITHELNGKSSNSDRKTINVR